MAEVQSYVNRSPSPRLTPPTPGYAVARSPCESLRQTDFDRECPRFPAGMNKGHTPNGNAAVPATRQSWRSLTWPRTILARDSAPALAAGIYLVPLVKDPGTRMDSSAGSPVHLSVQIPPELEMRPLSFKVSPYGTVIGFRARTRRPPSEGAAPTSRLYTRALNGDEVREVEGFPWGVEGWAFSPDSKWLAVVHRIAAGSASLRLSRVPLDRSAPPLAPLDSVQAT